MLSTSVWCSALLFFGYASAAQQPLIQSQNNTWNSFFQLTAAQIKAANLTEAAAHNLSVAIQYERTNYAFGQVQEDRFYDVPSSYDPSNPPPPGTMLKIEEYTKTSAYTLPPSVSMSRIMYVSESLNGTSVPATGYILWPYLPRTFGNLTSFNGTKANGSVYPIIAYPHGTSGQQPNCAVSHIRNLWDDWSEPFAMALQGYAVIAPDYVGLGIQGIISPYFILPAQANDIYTAVAASQSAFPHLLTKEFVVMGQSHGGGSAWAGAQRQYRTPMEGYLGTVAASPFTDILADIAADAQSENNVRIAGIAQGLNSVLATFELSDWITPVGVARIDLMAQIGGCSAAANYMFSGSDGNAIVKPGWNLTAAAKWYSNVTTNGGKPFAGPMLVIQGQEDPNANVNVTRSSVALQCRTYPKSELDYYEFEGIQHVPVLYAGQHVWTDWIDARFSGVPVKPGCQKQVVGPVRGVANIDVNVNWFMELDLFNYE